MIGLVSRRGVTKISRLSEQGMFKGCLLTPLNMSGKVVTNHPLDTNLEEYYRVINDIVIPDSMDVAPDIKGYPERMKKLINYTNPAFSDCWNFGVELQYRLVAPPEHQTEENLTKMRILRACMDLTFTMSAVVDDVVDESSERRKKPAWHKICDGGQWAGLYDGMVLGYLPFFLLKKHFSVHPSYAQLLEIFGMGNMLMLIGETVDVMGHQATPDPDHQWNITLYKAGHFVAMQAALGLTFAGITDKKVHEQVRDIYIILGTLIQTWDDFCDYFVSPKNTGKPPIDFQNGGTTWVSVTAMKYFNERQKLIFKECYGSSDPEAVETVRRLYDEIDMPSLYLRHMRKAYDRLRPMVEALPEARLREACRSHVDWLIGDVAHMALQN